MKMLGLSKLTVQLWVWPVENCGTLGDFGSRVFGSRGQLPCLLAFGFLGGVLSKYCCIGNRLFDCRFGISGILSFIKQLTLGRQLQGGAKWPSVSHRAVLLESLQYMINTCCQEATKLFSTLFRVLFRSLAPFTNPLNLLWKAGPRMALHRCSG